MKTTDDKFRHWRYGKLHVELDDGIPITQEEMDRLLPGCEPMTEWGGSGGSYPAAVCAEVPQ